MRLKTSALIVASLTGLAAWYASAPRKLDPTAWVELSGDASRGETVFNLGGCASCHMEKGAKGEARLRLGGGQALATSFGRFYVPNISPSAEGLAGWSTYDLANALLKGVSPAGRHYYPAFPYGSYMHLQLQDVYDLKAFLDTLPPVARTNTPHALQYPFNIRRTVGLWKMLFLTDDFAIDTTEDRGQYLVEGLGHCAECHTPRNVLGGLDRSRWLAGAPNPEGKGRIPNLTPAGVLARWSVEDIAYYLESGFTPEYDTVGSSMVEVVENLGKASADDRLAIARYLKALPAVASAP